jgi:O-antigen ligase
MSREVTNNRAEVDSVVVQSLQANSSRLWHWLEYVYVVTLLGTLTQGPVNKIWEGSSQVDPKAIEITKFATYILVQAPAIFLLVRRGISKNLLKGPIGLLLLFVSWMLLSTIWATSSSNTVFESLTLVLTCSVGLYVARSFSLIEQLSLFGFAMQPGLIFSWFAVRQNWAGSVQPEDGNWIGIYFNRNSLAPPAALGLLAASALLWIVLARRPKRWIAIGLTLIAVTLFDSYLLVRSGSSTSLGAVMVFGLVWLFWSVIRWWQRHKNISPKQILRMVYPSFLLGVIVMTWVGFRFQSVLLNRLGRKIDFNGREVLWRFSWSGFKNRPIIGWGWMSAWRTQEFFKDREFWWALTNNYWSHSAMMDVLLGGGIIGATLLVFAIIWSGARQLGSVCSEISGQWAFAATWFVIAASTQESFIIGNHFMLVLLVSSMIGYQANQNDDSLNKTNSPA